jgi:hypothetical protein
MLMSLEAKESKRKREEAAAKRIKENAKSTAKK